MIANGLVTLLSDFATVDGSAQRQLGVGRGAPVTVLPRAFTKDRR